jgi:hypothetical protein
VKIEHYGKNEVWAMVRIPWTIELENKKGGLKKILLGSYHEGKLIAASTCLNSSLASTKPQPSTVL